MLLVIEAHVHNNSDWLTNRHNLIFRSFYQDIAFPSWWNMAGAKATVDNSKKNQTIHYDQFHRFLINAGENIDRSMSFTKNVFLCMCMRVVILSGFPKRNVDRIDSYHSKPMHSFVPWVVHLLVACFKMNSSVVTIRLLPFWRCRDFVSANFSFSGLGWAGMHECVWFSGRWNDLITIESICLYYCWTCWNRTGEWMSVCSDAGAKIEMSSAQSAVGIAQTKPKKNEPKKMITFSTSFFCVFLRTSGQETQTLQLEHINSQFGHCWCVTLFFFSQSFAAAVRRRSMMATRAICLPSIWLCAKILRSQRF